MGKVVKEKQKHKLLLYKKLILNLKKMPKKNLNFKKNEAKNYFLDAASKLQTINN